MYWNLDYFGGPGLVLPNFGTGQEAVNTGKNASSKVPPDAMGLPTEDGGNPEGS